MDTIGPLYILYQGEGNGDGMTTIPFYPKENSDGMLTALLYLKGDSDGITTSPFFQRGIVMGWPPLHSL